MSAYTGPLPITTTNGNWAVSVSRSETGQENDVELSVYRTNPKNGNIAERLVFELPPSAAREVGKLLQKSADALDAEYPNQPNR